MEFKPDNFDKEFSFNKQKKTKKTSQGKMPSWLMILAGAAVIGGVIAAQQPALRTENNTLATINVATSQPVSVEPALFTGINDEKLDSSELEARFLSQGSQMNTQYIQPVSSDNMIQGVDLDISSVISASETTEPETKISDPTKAASETGIIKKQSAVPTSTIPAAPVTKGSDTVTQSVQAETGKEEANSADSTAVVWLNDKAYTVTIKPQEDAAEDIANTAVQRIETTETITRNEDEAFGTATEVPTAAEAPEQNAHTSIFTVDGKPYELQLTELDPLEDSQELTEQPIVWLAETPLQVVLDTEDSSADTDETAETVSESNNPIKIVLQPLPSEQTTALQLERFGEDYVRSILEPTTEPEIEPTEEPTPVPTSTPEDTNWLVSVFNNIFGSTPTQVPTPQVTIITLTPTPTVIQPTATPITILMMPTAAAQEPVRLDITETPVPTVTAAQASDTQAKDGDLDDPALREEDEQTAPVNDEPTPTNTPYRTPSSEKIEAVVVDSFETPAVQPTPDELPHTGMAEGWNIPSMLGLLAGLLLVILGVRRLRTKN